MQATKVIIMGARGRMGSTLVNLTQQDPELELAAAVERPDLVHELDSLGCITGTDLEEILPQLPRAVIIDFTQPETSLQAAAKASRYKNPMVIGTTGFDTEQQKELSDYADEVPIFWAPNMSVGIAVLLEILPKLAQLLGPDYDVELSEIHHKHKKDAPSGTAKKIAQELAAVKGWDEQKTLRYCREGFTGERPLEEIGIQALRGGDVVGEHTVYFFGPGERIDVTHRVYSRETFTKGALRAAKWISGRSAQKLYTMSDLFADLMSQT